MTAAAAPPTIIKVPIFKLSGTAIGDSSNNSLFALHFNLPTEHHHHRQCKDFSFIACQWEWLHRWWSAVVVVVAVHWWHSRHYLFGHSRLNSVCQLKTVSHQHLHQCLSAVSLTSRSSSNGILFLLPIFLFPSSLSFCPMFWKSSLCLQRLCLYQPVCVQPKTDKLWFVLRCLNIL